MIKLFGKSRIINFDEMLVVFREAGKISYVDGKAVKPKPIEFEIKCNIQPMQARELIMVPEHDRIKESFSMYYDNNSIKFLTDVGDLGVDNIRAEIKVNDRVVRDGSNYQVQSIENWGSYGKATIVRIDIGPYKNKENGQ